MTLKGKTNYPTNALEKGLLAVSAVITGTGSAPTADDIEGPFGAFTRVSAGFYFVAFSGSNLIAGSTNRTRQGDYANFLGCQVSCSEEGVSAQVLYAPEYGAIGNLNADGLVVILTDQTSDTNTDPSDGEQVHITAFYRRANTGV